MRSTALAIFSLIGCGGGTHHTVDSQVDTPVDTPAVTGTLKVTTYRSTGPVNTQLVVVQDGDGAWTAVTGTAGVYTATLHSDHFGFAVACTGNMFSSVYTIYAAVSDGLDWYIGDCSEPSAATATVNGTVTGAAAANALRVMNGFDFVDVAAGTTTYSLPTSAGPSRMFAEELVNKRPIKIVGVDTTVTDGGTVDFNLANGFAPVTKALAANTTLAGASLSYRDIHTIAILDRSATPATDYRGIPANQLGNGLNRLSVSAPSTDTTSQFVIRYFKSPIDQAITIPPVLTLAQAPTATATPYPTAAAKVAVQPGITTYDIDFSTTNQTSMFTHDWFTEMTAAYVDTAFPSGTITYAMPDLHAVAGWQSAFQLESGLPIDWLVEDNTYVNVDNFNLTPPDQFAFHDGGEEKFTSTNGQIAAP
jgi:hypothetical protein